MKHFVSISILSVLFVACGSVKQPVNNPIIRNKADRVFNEKFDTQNATEKKWTYLCSQEMCFAGGQHFGAFSEKGMTFQTNQAWKVFFKNNKNVLFPFLIKKLDSSIQTKLHICGNHYAIEAEVAIFALEHIVNKNWYDSDVNYPVLNKYKTQKKKATSILELSILEDKKAKQELKVFFRKEYKK